MSRFAPPYDDATLPLVLRALDALQYPNYPTPLTPGQTTRFTFTSDQQTRLAAHGLRDPANAARVHPDAPYLVGQQLYTALVEDPAARQALGSARSLAVALGHTLDVRLRFGAAATALAALPWELLWTTGDAPTPLLLDGARAGSLVREILVDTPLPPAAPVQRPLTLLVIAPQTGIDAATRAAAHQARAAALQPLVDAGALVVHEVSPATRHGVLAAVTARAPALIVYFGHGGMRRGRALLRLDAPDGGHDDADVTALQQVFVGAQLVLLIACDGSQIAPDGDLVGGLAPALSAARVPAVLGMQTTVRSSVGADVLGRVLGALVAGASLQEAVASARRALFVTERERVSWWVPALYLRQATPGAWYLPGTMPRQAETQPETPAAPDPHAELRGQLAAARIQARQIDARIAALGGFAHAHPSDILALRRQRAAIARLKEALRARGIDPGTEPIDHAA